MTMTSPPPAALWSAAESAPEFAAGVRALIELALAEDIGRGDLTTEATVDAGAAATAVIRQEQAGVVCGLPLVARVFATLDPRVAVVPLAEEGSWGDGRIVARKTTPGHRTLEKYAVRVGGCHNHRAGLDDGILIKDNHIRAAGGIVRAVRAARRRTAPMQAIEVEVTTLDELDEAIAAGAAVVLLDNMDIGGLRAAVARGGGGCGWRPAAASRSRTCGMSHPPVWTMSRSAP